jgi:hypothetical protein
VASVHHLTFLISLSESGPAMWLLYISCHSRLVTLLRSIIFTSLLSLSSPVTWLLSTTLKGQCHEIFCFRFFLWITFPQAPENNNLGHFEFFQKFAEIFASQGAPPV